MGDLTINNMGSIFAGRGIQDGGSDIIKDMTASMAAANIKFANYDFKREDLAVLTPFIQRVEGTSGTTLPMEDYRMFFQDASDALSPMQYNEEYSEWVLRSKSYEALNASFTPRWWKKNILQGRNPGTKVLQRTMAAVKTYEDKFLPNLVFQALLKVPEAGGGYYDNFGALRNTTVDKSLINNYDETAGDGEFGGLVRNHYRAIAGTTGVEMDDYKFISKYADEYININPEDGEVFGTLGTIQSLSEVFESTKVRDELNRMGTVDMINGLRHRVTKMLPENILAFVFAGNDDKIFAELTNPDERFKGLRVEGEKIGMKFETVGDLQGSKFVIEDIGMHFIGRHLVIFLDIDETRNSGDTSDRVMTADGITAMKDKAKRLVAEWKRDNIISK